MKNAIKIPMILFYFMGAAFSFRYPSRIMFSIDLTLFGSGPSGCRAAPHACSARASAANL